MAGYGILFQRERGRPLVCVFVEDGNEGCMLATGRRRWCAFCRAKGEERRLWVFFKVREGRQ
jgi:hypothetical protein